MPLPTVASHPPIKVPVWAVLALAAGVLASACVRKPMVVAADPPPLSVPVVPPRLVGPVQVEEEAPPPVEEPQAQPAPRSAPRAPRVTRGAGEGTQSKPQDAPVEAPKPDAPDAPPPSSEQPPNLLRTVETADDREAARGVQEIIDRAESNLQKVNYKTLSNTAKAQHDTATRLIAQAEDALRKRSFVFARYLADKAEVFSRSVVNR